MCGRSSRPKDPFPEAFVDIATVNQTPIADDQPTLPVIRMRLGAIQGLKHAPSNRWREALLSAGMLAEVPQTDDPDDPRAWLAAVQTLLMDLIQLEDERDGLMWIDDHAGLRDAPWWLWVMLLVQPWLAVELGKRQPDDIDRLFTLLWVYGLPGGIAVVLCGALIGVIHRRRKDRKARLIGLRGKISEVRKDLADGAARTLSRDFVARSGHRLLVSTPSLALAEPDAVAAMEARIEAFQRDPPDSWVPLDIAAPPPAS